jgi:hypothetical protein
VSQEVGNLASSALQLAFWWDFYFVQYLLTYETQWA